MMSRKSRRWCQLLSGCFVVFLAAFSIQAQVDPNPDSPTPILISEPNNLRAAAAAAGRNLRAINFSKLRSRAFEPNSKVVLYVTNLDLMEGEGATAFRLYVEDALGRKYRFPVLDIRPLRGQEWIYALTVELRDELGFWEQGAESGDVLVGVTWRGMASNRLRLGFGKTGGAIKDDEGATPSPAPAAAPIAKRADEEQSRVGYLHSGDRKRFLEQASFGPTKALDDRIRRIGLRTWLAEQLDAPYPTFPYPDFDLMPGNVSADCLANTPRNCVRDHYTMYPVQNWFYKEAFYGNVQLKHRVAWSLSQLWVISGVEIQQSSHMIAYHKLLSRNAFGNYRNLIDDITLNPGMGNYLDMVRSTRNSPNENYAREILQLFNIGLFMLNQDGTLQRDAQNNPIPTYDQTTVNNFTKVFTGWGLCENAALCPNRTVGAQNYKDPMLLNQANHNIEAKTLLSYCGVGVANCTIPSVSQNIAPNTNGNTELQMALDNIFNHPNVAPFVSRILIQHLVTSDPTPAYVGRVAAVFNNNGSNVRGDLKAVVRAILLDAEARGNAKTDPNYGKLREPVQLATNIYRQFDVRGASGGFAQSDGVVDQIVQPMGQRSFYSPTVFNYYPPDYVVPGPGLNGPEFAIMTTGTAIARVNFVNTIVFGQIGASNPNAPYGTSLNLAEMQSLAAADATGNRMLDVLDTRLLHGTMTAQNRQTILAAVTALPTTDTLGRARAAIYLVATSSQYQVQR